MLPGQNVLGQGSRWAQAHLYCIAMGRRWRGFSAGLYVPVLEFNLYRKNLDEAEYCIAPSAGLVWRENRHGYSRPHRRYQLNEPSHKAPPDRVRSQVADW